MVHAVAARIPIADPRTAAERLWIEVEVSGWDQGVTLASARPGAVRGAVEDILRRLGLTVIER